RRHRRRQRLTHITAMHMKPIRQRADRQPLALMRLADLLEQLHLRPSAHAQRSGAPTRSWWTPRAAPRVGPKQTSTTARGGAKSDEHAHFCARPSLVTSIGAGHVAMPDNESAQRKATRT